MLFAYAYYKGVRDEMLADADADFQTCNSPLKCLLAPIVILFLTLSVITALEGFAWTRSHFIHMILTLFIVYLSCGVASVVHCVAILSALLYCLSVGLLNPRALMNITLGVSHCRY